MKLLDTLGIQRDTKQDKDGKEFIPSVVYNSVTSSEISDEEYLELCTENKMVSDGSHLPETEREEYIKTIKSSDNVMQKDRILTFIGSNETVDRHGDIVRVAGWDTKDYKKNPVFLWGHDYYNAPIGRAVKVWKTADALMFRIYFPEAEVSEQSDKVFKLYKAGILSAVSVGFMPTKANYPDSDEERKQLGLGTYGVEFLEQKLWELSAVSVPSNPDALVVDSAEMAECCKSLGIEVSVRKDLSDKQDIVPGLEEKIKSLEESFEKLETKFQKLQSLVRSKLSGNSEGNSGSDTKSNESKAESVYDLVLEGIGEYHKKKHSDTVKQIMDTIKNGGRNDT